MSVFGLHSLSGGFTCVARFLNICVGLSDFGVFRRWPDGTTCARAFVFRTKEHQRWSCALHHSLSLLLLLIDPFKNLGHFLVGFGISLCHFLVGYGYFTSIWVELWVYVFEERHQGLFGLLSFGLLPGEVSSHIVSECLDFLLSVSLDRIQGTKPLVLLVIFIHLRLDYNKEISICILLVGP